MPWHLDAIKIGNLNLAFTTFGKPETLSPGHSGKRTPGATTCFSKELRNPGAEDCERTPLKTPVSSFAPFALQLAELPQEDLPLKAKGETSHPSGATPLPEINIDFGDSPVESPASAPQAPATIDTRAALEAMPHLLKQIQSLWLSRDLNTFIAQLFLDSRDGARNGFPVEATRELLLLSRINQQLRAEETASLLGLSLVEASDLIARGDHLAMGHTNSAEDVWAQHVAHGSRRRQTPPANKRISELFSPLASRIETAASPQTLSSKLINIVHDRPPLPPSVRIDLTTPQALRSARAGSSEGGIMDRNFFRCLARELGTLPIGQLVLSSLGDSEKCEWLATGIRFARTHCRHKRLVLHVDLLSTSEALIRQCILEGIDHLVIFLNQASGKWRARALAIADADPDYFRREIARLVTLRDDYQQTSGRRCELSVSTNNRRCQHAMREVFGHLDELPGLVSYTPVLLPAGISPRDARARGRCHCLAPFIEAHVRTNGHLVACAQDHSGYSYAADLTQTSFADAWQSPAFRMTRQRVTQGEKPGRLCEVCPHHVVGLVAH